MVENFENVQLWNLKHRRQMAIPVLRRIGILRKPLFI